MQHTFLLSEDREPAISPLGLRCAAGMSKIARRDRQSLSGAMALLPRGMKQIRHLTTGIANPLALPRSTTIQSVTIHKTLAWRLGVVRLGPDVTIPLHDHPEAYAVSYVLGGKITVDAFSFAKKCSHGITQLYPAWSVECGPEESAILDPWDINIHCVHASQGGAVLLTGTFANGIQLESRRWFFTTGHPQSGTRAVVVDQATAHDKMKPSSVALDLFLRQTNL